MASLFRSLPCKRAVAAADLDHDVSGPQNSLDTEAELNLLEAAKEPSLESRLSCNRRSGMAAATIAGLLVGVIVLAAAGGQNVKEPATGVLATATSSLFAQLQHTQCPGSLGIGGLGQAALVNAQVNTPNSSAGEVELQGDNIVVHMSGRSYLGDYCHEGQYDHNAYKAINLLGKTMMYTTDLSGVGCGCNAAVYLTSLKQNALPSLCNDYYCDANAVCGIRCSEIDIQEANKFAWRSTLHVAEDGIGVGFGYGGNGPHEESWTADQYGPGGRCIDTTQPFQVNVAFPVHPDGSLMAMQTVLSQPGRPCTVAGIVSNYTLNVKNGMGELSQALGQGMAPIVSYWSSSDILWLDGKGPLGGPCAKDNPKQCADSIKIYGMSIADGIQPYAVTTTTTTTMPLVTTPSPVVAVEASAPLQAAGFDSGAPPVQAAGFGAGALPAGWQAAKAPGGNVYYFNRNTGETSWELPHAM